MKKSSEVAAILKAERCPNSLHHLFGETRALCDVCLASAIREQVKEALQEAINAVSHGTNSYSHSEAIRKLIEEVE